MYLLVVFFSFLQLALCVKISRKSRFKGLLINILSLSFIFLYVFPYLLNSRKFEDIGGMVFFGSFGIFFGTFLVYLFKKNKITKSFNNIEDLTILKTSANLFLSFVFYGISIYAIWLSLQSIGGIQVLLTSAGGGREYLEARVNGANSGILGLLIWLAPISISYIFFDALTESYRIRRFFKYLVFLICLVALVFLFMALTVRHNTISTLLMLFLTAVLVKGFSRKKLIVVLVLSLSVFYVFQAIRLSTIDELNFGKLSELRSDETEHLEVSNEIYNKVNKIGYTGISHMGDVFIFIIPRALWKSKPKTSYLNRTYFNDFAQSGSEKAIGILGEGYTIIGNFGVFLLSTFFAMFIFALQLRLDISVISLRFYLTVLALVPLSYIGIRTGVFGKQLLSIFVMLIQGWVYALVYRVRFKRWLF